MRDASDESIATATLDVSGMNCASCVAHVEKSARSVAGVRDCRVNLATGRASIEFDPSKTNPGQVAGAIAEGGYPATPADPAQLSADSQEQRIGRQAKEASAWLWRAAVGVALWLPVELLHWLRMLTHSHVHALAQADWLGWAALASSTIALIYVGGKFYASAWAALKHKTSNMDTLIAMGASVAYFYSLTYFVGGLAGAWRPPMGHELYFMEASGLLALISLGHWLEARARQSAGRAIRELMNLAPATSLRLKSATIPTDHQQESFEQIPATNLEIGDRILVRPGDRIATDGVVIDGRSSVDQSMMSGEPLPVLRAPGDEVIGSTFNHDGRLIVRVTKVGQDTALAQIVKLVENAQTSKPPAQKLADRVAAIFVPTVLCIALVTAIGWFAWAHAHDWSAGQTAAAMAKAVCSVLIIACPCALGLAVPAAVMVGTGLGARHGILIRDIDAIQNAERVNTVVLDKTGTLTRGKPVVSRIIALDGASDQQILNLAASAEQYSSHPLAQAIVNRARELGVAISPLEDFNTYAGEGVAARVEAMNVLIGNNDLLARFGDGQTLPSSAQADSGSTLVTVARRTDDGKLEALGTIVIADQLKEDSTDAVARLHAMGLKTMLLTGDHAGAAAKVAKEVGIEAVRAQVKPDGKAAVIREIQNGASEPNSGKSIVAMVGDGINDAPALAAADLGIAIGGGSDVARETGGIVLVGGSLKGVAASILLSRATMRTIRQNLFWAFIYNVVAIPFAAVGLVNPIVAAGAMALSDVTVIGNALLLRRKKLG